MSIKKCVNGSFVNDVYKEYGTDTDTITLFPKKIIGDGQNISAYSIKGNMTQNEVCGDKTANMFNVAELTWNSGYLNDNGQPQSSTVSHYTGNYTAVEPNTEYYFSGTLASGSIAYRYYYYDNSKQWISRTQDGTRTFTTPANCYYMQVQCSVNITAPTDWCLVKGSTAPSEYIPYGFQITISLSQNTYNIYITEPLRKSLDGSNLYDTIEGNGTLTRRVDANGDALTTPTTEQITVPTLPTTGTAEQFDISTTLKPSEVSLTYHGWHEHQDTKF